MADACIAFRAKLHNQWVGTSLLFTMGWNIGAHGKWILVQEVNSLLESMLPRFISYDNLFTRHANCLLESIFLPLLVTVMITRFFLQ
jgi:hypothetical protein